jgi:hypothetical protein
VGGRRLGLGSGVVDLEAGRVLYRWADSTVTLLPPLLARNDTPLSLRLTFEGPSPSTVVLEAGEEQGLYCPQVVALQLQLQEAGQTGQACKVALLEGVAFAELGGRLMHVRVQDLNHQMHVSIYF